MKTLYIIIISVLLTLAGTGMASAQTFEDTFIPCFNDEASSNKKNFSAPSQTTIEGLYSEYQQSNFGAFRLTTITFDAPAFDIQKSAPNPWDPTPGGEIPIADGLAILLAFGALYVLYTRRKQ